MIKIIVCGASGRMGKRLVSLILESDDLKLVGATEYIGSPSIGKDAGEIAGIGSTGVRIVDDLSSIVSGADVIIDFTMPEATLGISRVAGGQAKKAMVVGTTGLSPEQLSQFKQNVLGIPCVHSPNYSVGVNLLFKLVSEAAKILGDGYDVEIIEAHHRLKKDAPSGTAVKLAEVVAQALGRDLSQDAVYGRKGIVGERKQKEIGVLAVRAGDIVGDHTVIFGGIGERIELVHRAQSRDTFAQGALRAVRFVAKASPGLYNMADVLGVR